MYIKKKRTNKFDRQKHLFYNKSGDVDGKKNIACRC